MAVQEWLERNSMAKWLTISGFLCLFVAPTFVSYRRYTFRWDDAEYMMRAVQVSRNFWVGNLDWVLGGMVSIRPPAMTLLGVPWGELRTWESTGDCFVTLGALESLLAATCLYLLLRIGIKPIYLVLACACVFASLGPFPAGSSAHDYATGFLADSLFAWTTLAAVLLVPFEARANHSTISGSAISGSLWGLILSLGTMTKFNFLYFVGLIFPALLFIKFRRDGVQKVLAAFIAFACFSAPAALYLIRWGGPAFENAKASSFGAVSTYYYVPLLKFVGDTIRESPGMLLSVLLTAVGLIYVVIKRPALPSVPACFALLVMLGFGVTVFAATNKQIRYAFPVIIALPFLAGLILSGVGNPVSRRIAAATAALTFCILTVISVPMRYRPDQRSISRSSAVLAIAAQTNARSVLLATDSPTLNDSLMKLASEFSVFPAPPAGTLAYQAMSGLPIDNDFRTLAAVDLVAFQDQRSLYPAFTNLRVPEYQNYVQQIASGPIRIGDDVGVYLIHKR